MVAYRLLRAPATSNASEAADRPTRAAIMLPARAKVDPMPSAILAVAIPPFMAPCE